MCIALWDFFTCVTLCNDTHNKKNSTVQPHPSSFLHPYSLQPLTCSSSLSYCYFVLLKWSHIVCILWGLILSSLSIISSRLIQIVVHINACVLLLNRGLCCGCTTVFKHGLTEGCLGSSQFGDITNKAVVYTCHQVPACQRLSSSEVCFGNHLNFSVRKIIILYRKSDSYRVRP